MKINKLYPYLSIKNKFNYKKLKIIIQINYFKLLS